MKHEDFETMESPLIIMKESLREEFFLLFEMDDPGLHFGTISIGEMLVVFHPDGIFDNKVTEDGEPVDMFVVDRDALSIDPQGIGELRFENGHLVRTRKPEGDQKDLPGL